MYEFENYKNNLNVIDKFNLKDVPIDKSVIYRGDLDIVNKQAEERKSATPPLAAAVIGLDNTAAPFPEKDPYFNSYTDIDAQEQFLSSKPSCYLILGKPGSGAYSLGEAISKKLNCIHLCPRKVITDEIEQRSPTGICIDFNMRHNSICKVDTILPIMLKKLESPVVKHRGYVISGIPLVTTSKKTSYLFHSVHGEESTQVMDELLFDIICNLKKKRPKRVIDTFETPQSSFSSEGLKGEDEPEEEEEENEEAVEEETEQKVELPKYLLESCSNIVLNKKPYMITKDSMILQQILDIMNIKMEPDLIIYITSPDTDLVTKRNHKYVNYINNSMTNEPFTLETDSDLRWPSKYAISDYKGPFATHIFNPKLNCRQPINFMENTIQQLCNYRNIVHPFIEKKLNDFNPKSIIKLDARTSLHNMMDHVLETLLLIPIKPVLIPEPLYLEEPPEDMEEFWTSISELNVIHSDPISFMRYPSLWHNRCPVELKNRQSVKGNPRFAVILFKHVYLLSSLGAMIAFCRNPRPYLQLRYLEPTCRIIIIGTKTTGKSLIANCLSWIFDTPILCYKNFLETEKQKKYKTFAKTILSEIIATIEDTRFAKWQSTEMERFSQLEAWNNFTLATLKAYVPYLRESAQYKRKETLQVSDKETITEEEEIGPDEEYLQNINYYKKILSHIPFLDDLQQCEIAIADKGMLNKFAPIEFITMTPKPDIPVLGDNDVTIAIAEYITANELQKELEPTVEDLMTEMVRVLSDIDLKCKKSTNSEQIYGKFIIDGFPSDMEFWGYLSDAKLLPDYTIAIIENRELSPELMAYYANVDKVFKNYQERYLLANDPLITTKLKINGAPNTKEIDIKMLVHETVNNTLDLILSTEALPSSIDILEQNEAEFMASFTTSVEKFREDWDNVKLKLEDNSKCFIEVELENKTDIEIVEETLLCLRKSYYIPCNVNEDADAEDVDVEEDSSKDNVTYNDPRSLCETNIYCPIAYYDHGVLWEGKPEFSVKFNNKTHYFSKQECSELFQNNVTNYQSYNKPYKKLPALRICVIGCIGSGKSTVSQMLAKELGLVHIDFGKIINDYLMPKHFKKVGWQYENSFTDIPIDDEAVTELEMGEEDENLISNVMSNETEMRLMVYNYLERGSPIISILMQRLILKLWFQDSYAKTGFVLDGYPRLPNDIEDMMSTFCIPDLVIELESNMEMALERVSPIMFKTWKLQLNEAKTKARMQFDKERQDWINFITKNVVSKLIVTEIVNTLPINIDEPVKAPSTESVIIDADPSGSFNVDSDLFNIYNDFIQEYPEPVDLTEWEKPDDVKERINSRIESIYEVDDQNIENIKDLLFEQRIKVVSVDGTKPINKLLRLALIKLSGLRNRTTSFFEQSYVVNNDIAEMLLLEGFYFFSKFKRMCPVHLFDNPQTIFNTYKLSRHTGKIFTVAHRSYIYFISSEENVRQFRRNPLMYIDSNVIKTFIEYPLRIGVIGAPKSGKSALAKKLSKRYGLLCISRGGAIRNILQNMPWTELASRITKEIQSGEMIDYDLTIKAVQATIIDHRTNSYGFVLDGFPEFPKEARSLADEGLYPTIILYISSAKNSALRNSQREIYYDILKYKPPYSIPFIDNRYLRWQENNYSIKNWINIEFQNQCTLDGDVSKWQCLKNAVDIIESKCKKIHYYLANVKTNVVPVDVMCISRESFQLRMSHFKDLCPLCLRKNILRHSGYPVDKKGMVQYNNRFYWICRDHIRMVLNQPHRYLTTESVNIAEVPAPVKTINMSLVYEKGICIVTYADNLPSQTIVRGCHEFAACYHGNTYLFCSEKCVTKFMEKPHMYYDIEIFKQAKEFPVMSLKNIPILGYLEQTVGSIITDACCSVNVLRPKYPGLSYPLSGLLFIALYLKTHNPLLDKAVLNQYEKAFLKFKARCKMMIDVGLRLRSMDNPFADYPKCCPSTTRQSSISMPKHFTRRVPVPDERYDYLCEYHKPLSKVPAFLNVVDIAGLVRGAAEGQGLGNAFLSHIKACDAIFNLCRAFDDEDVIHVDGDVNPVRDLETIGEELRLKDEEQLMQNIEKLDRVANRGADKKLKPEHDALLKIKSILVDEKKHIRFGDWSSADIEVINKYLFLTSKPALYLVNLSEKDYTRKKNKWLPKLKEWIDKNDPGAPLIPFSGVLESKLLDMEPTERQAYLKEHNITSALDKIIVQGYKALQLEYFFTAGPDEVKAWTIQKGTKAPQAAGRIHTDFEKGFIMAEVMHFKDFKEEGTEAACKSAGKYRQQGRNYVVEDGDIIFFKFNAGAGLKDAKKK